MNKTKPQGPSEQECFTAALSYVWILCIYALVKSRGSSFIKFHAKQGLALFVIESISPLLFFLMPFVIIICIAFSLWGIKSSLEGKYWTVPLIGEWLKKTEL